MILSTNLILADQTFASYLFSLNKAHLNIKVIHHFLCYDSYWAKNIPQSIVEAAIEHSIVIGIYNNQMQQAGFGRMITDRATFGYLADIFVLPEHRGLGLSKHLMTMFCQLADQFQLRRFLLTTQDAHELYLKSGFSKFPYPERMMSRAGVVYPLKN